MADVLLIAAEPIRGDIHSYGGCVGGSEKEVMDAIMQMTSASVSVPSANLSLTQAATTGLLSWSSVVGNLTVQDRMKTGNGRKLVPCQAVCAAFSSPPLFLQLSRQSTSAAGPPESNPAVEYFVDVIEDENLMTWKVRFPAKTGPLYNVVWLGKPPHTAVSGIPVRVVD